MVKRHAFLENLDTYMDDEARRNELVQIIRPLLAKLAEATRSAADPAGADATIDQTAAALAAMYLQGMREGMRAGAEWAGVRSAFAKAANQGGIQAAIDGDAAFLAEAFHQGERRGRQTLDAATAMKAGEVGGHS